MVCHTIFLILCTATIYKSHKPGIDGIDQLLHLRYCHHQSSLEFHENKYNLLYHLFILIFRIERARQIGRKIKNQGVDEYMYPKYLVFSHIQKQHLHTVTIQYIYVNIISTFRKSKE